MSFFLHSSLNLFEQESVNIYAEGVMEAKAVYQTLKVIPNEMIRTILVHVIADFPFCNGGKNNYTGYLGIDYAKTCNFYCNASQYINKS